MIAVLSSAIGLACGCPTGNIVVPEREVSFNLRLQTGNGLLAGHGSSPPGGQGISWKRATLEGSTQPPLKDDLVLFSMSPGCHADATGSTVCDYGIRTSLIVHGVMAGPAAIDLDDQRAALKVSVEMIPAISASGPCPGKPELNTCPLDPQPMPTPDVSSYTGLMGHVTITELGEDCTHVISSCSLGAQGTFDLSATGPNGETIELASGALTATDTFMYSDSSSCTD
jgi:hypothetical protein